ncbi:MAG: DUF1292 domain-containing protein [Gorillibacterium sp.]|nr:DUF1292 domain-containing protein [Gorillibacterium sp.]
MSQYSREDIVAISLVKEAVGEEVVLIDQEGVSSTYQLLAEFSVAGVAYAIIQNEEMSKNDEVDVFHILQQEDGSLELESVDDDGEWEDIAELYDELTTTFEE